MKRNLTPVVWICLLMSVSTIKADNLKVLPMSASPSGKYVLGLAGSDDKGFTLHVLSSDSHTDVAAPARTQDFLNETPPKYHVRAVWNHNENIVAVSSGNRAENHVYLFRLTEKSLVEISVHNSESMVLDWFGIPWRINRLQVDGPVWLDQNKLAVDLAGSVVAGSKFEGFRFLCDWRIDGKKATASGLEDKKKRVD